MKKIYLLLAVVLIAFSAFAVAETDNIDITTSADAIAVTNTAVAEAITATNANSIRATKVVMPVKKLHLVGYGLIISTTNPMDFMSAKTAAGIVKIRTPDGIKERSLGVLILDNKKYRLKNVVLEDETLTADIYDRAGENQAGKFTLNKYERPGRTVWAGPFELNDATYNAYFLGMVRNFKPIEILDKVANYCEDNPTSEKCKTIVDCGNNPDCKARISNFCQNNLDNEKCKELQKEYCLRNADDSRCEEYLKNLCRDNPRLSHCRIKTSNGEEFVSIKSAKELRNYSNDKTGDEEDDNDKSDYDSEDDEEDDDAVVE